MSRWLPELAGRQVLTSPGAALSQCVPAEREITVADLLTCQSGYGIATQESPLMEAMAANGTDAGPEPVSIGAQEWLARLSELPLAFQPGTGWRYHHSYALLGILLSRVTGRPLEDHLREDIFERIGMPDTGFWVPREKCSRLPSAYRGSGQEREITEPAGGGFYAGPPPFDVSHSELVSTAADFARFAQVLRDGEGLPDGEALIGEAHVAAMTSDQVPDSSKTDDDFFPGFWASSGWGYGGGVDLGGEHAGRFGWSGGQGTDFAVDPGRGYRILLTQAELSPETFDMIFAFRGLE